MAILETQSARPSLMLSVAAMLAGLGLLFIDGLLVGPREPPDPLMFWLLDGAWCALFFWSCREFGRWRRRLWRVM